MGLTTKEGILQEAARRETELRSNFVQNEKRLQQHLLAGSLLHRKVHDIVPFEDSNGDDIVLFVYIDSKLQDFRNGDKAIVMIVLSEPKKQRLYFDTVEVRDSRYFLADGSLLVKALAEGTYSY